MPPNDPFAELIARLERDGDVPLAWIVAHAPEGDLRAAWAACSDALRLVQVGARLGGAPAAVLAACAGARDALGRAGGAGGPEPAALAAAIDASEAWARGACDRGVVDAAFDGVSSVDASPPSPARCAAAPSPASAWQIGRVLALLVYFAMDLSSGAATLDDYCDALVVDDAMSDALDAATWAAPALRARLPCPTLDQLRAAFGRG